MNSLRSTILKTLLEQSRSEGKAFSQLCDEDCRVELEIKNTKTDKVLYLQDSRSFDVFTISDITPYTPKDKEIPEMVANRIQEAIKLAMDALEIPY